jgi:hypothetical protein
MSTRLKFRDYMLDETEDERKAPTDPRCEALPFLWSVVCDELARKTASGLSSLYSLIGFATNFTEDYSHDELRLASVLLWHRYKAALWLARKAG